MHYPISSDHISCEVARKREIAARVFLADKVYCQCQRMVLLLIHPFKKGFRNTLVLNLSWKLVGWTEMDFGCHLLWFCRFCFKKILMLWRNHGFEMSGICRLLAESLVGCLSCSGVEVLPFTKSVWWVRTLPCLPVWVFIPETKLLYLLFSWRVLSILFAWCVLSLFVWCVFSLSVTCFLMGQIQRGLRCL